MLQTRSFGRKNAYILILKLWSAIKTLFIKLGPPFLLCTFVLVSHTKAHRILLSLVFQKACRGRPRWCWFPFLYKMTKIMSSRNGFELPSVYRVPKDIFQVCFSVLSMQRFRRKWPPKLPKNEPELTFRNGSRRRWFHIFCNIFLVVRALVRVDYLYSELSYEQK